MRKQNLFNLAGEVRKIIGRLPIIVGSQAVFAVTDYPPEIARLSIECDFLLIGESFRFRDKVTDELGVFSDYQTESGFYADGLGRATVVLPEDWEERLVELKDENGETIALCAEIYDVAVSKLVAGREKDFEFLGALLDTELLQIETFLERAKTILRQPASEALPPRIQKFTEFLTRKKARVGIIGKLRDFEREITKEK